MDEIFAIATERFDLWSSKPKVLFHRLWKAIAMDLASIGLGALMNSMCELPGLIAPHATDERLPITSLSLQR